MPTFNFSISVSKIDNRKKSYKDNIKEIVFKNIKGVIQINENAEFYVSLEDGFDYPINSECYKCKGHQKVYRQGEYDKKRVVLIRNQGEYGECNSNYWLPFDTGCCVEGTLVYNKITDTKIFTIDKCYVDNTNNKAKEAYMFYKEHIKEINDIIRRRRVNEF